MKIEFKTNYKKTLEAVLYLLAKRPSVNLYNVMKSLFEADKIHLNKYGRPVTGDIYMKKSWGVLPEVAYGIFQQDEMVLNAIGVEEAPITKIKEHHFKADRKPNLEYLSESDIEALDAGAEAYFDLDFGAVEKKNHKEKCWNESEYHKAIDFDLMIENSEIREYLSQLDTLSIVV